MPSSSDYTLSNAFGLVFVPIDDQIVNANAAGVGVEFTIVVEVLQGTSINFESIDPTETYFALPIIAVGGECDAANMDSQACLDSNQAETQLVFTVVDRADAPQIRFSDSNGYAVSETLSTSVQFPFRLENTDEQSWSTVVSSPPFVSDSDMLAPAPGVDSGSEAAQLTFATEDARQPILHVSAEVRLSAGASLPPGVPSVSYYNVELERTRTAVKQGFTVTAYKITLSVDGEARGSSGTGTRLHCSPQCPEGLEVVITGRSIGQHPSVPSTEMVLPLSVINVNEAPVFGSDAQGGIVAQIPENSAAGAAPQTSGTFTVFDFDQSDSITGCTVSAAEFPNGLFDATVGSLGSGESLFSDGVSVSLALASGVQLDHETVDEVSAQLTCSDSSGASSSISFQVRIVDVNEAPYMATRVDTTDICFSENPSAGELASGALRIDDPDTEQLASLEVRVESCNIDEDGMAVCQPSSGTQYADFSSCVDVVEITNNAQDPFHGSSSTERRVRLAFRDSSECRELANYEASFGSVAARDATGKPVRYLRVVVDDGTPAGRRL